MKHKSVMVHGKAEHVKRREEKYRNLKMEYSYRD
jgi:nitroimidazol reductase NimA-like FMN-containing flavoprotein (pyridoxamine 5'-phosphate oxidase superfamily)